MFKLIKLTFFSVFIFVGLYFFGDFKVNDTNVKDFLQKNVTINNIVSTKNKIVRIYNNIMQFVDAVGDKIPSQTTATTSYKKSSSNTKTVTPTNTQSFDSLSSKDRREMIKLLKSLDK